MSTFFEISGAAHALASTYSEMDEEKERIN